MQDMKKLITYTDACYFNAKTLDFVKGKLSLSEDKIRKYKFTAKLSLQCSNIFYSIGQKKKSLKFASAAYKNSCKALQETFEVCKKQQILIKNKLKHTKLTKTEQNKLLLIQRAIPTLEAVQVFLNKGILYKVGMRSALGLKGDPEWVSMFNVNEMVNLTPVRSSEFLMGMGIQAEFTKDYLFYKIGLLALSLNSFGLRNIQTGNKELGYKYCQSAQKFLKNFFTEDCPLIKDLSLSNEKFSKETENSPNRQKRQKKEKPVSYSISKFNVHSSSFTKFRNIYERQGSEGNYKISPKKKVKRNVSMTPSVFREIKKKIAFSELKLNVE